MNLDISARLRKVRSESQSTQQDIANALGIGLQRYQAYEQGRAEPSLETLMKLKDVYGFRTIDDLLTGKQYGGGFSKIEKAYMKAGAEKRRIVDFVLGV